MKKTKRDLFFSFFSIFLIAFMMMAQLSSGLVVYAETFHDFGATPYNGNGQNGPSDPGNDLGRSGSDNSNNADSGEISATNNDASDGTSAPRGDNETNNATVWGWILAVIAAIIIIAIIASLSSKRRKR